MTKYRTHPTYSHYQVGSDGSVIGHSGRILRPTISDTGYRRIKVVCDDGKYVDCYVHIMVCETYHGPRPSRLHVVAHGDGHKENNAAVNLRWATSKENSQDSLRHGRIPCGESHCLSKLTESAVRDIRSSTETNRALATKYGVGKNQIRAVKSRRAWKQVV